MLNRDQDPFLNQWELDLTTHAAKVQYSRVVDFVKQSEVEHQVTKYLQENMHFVVFRVDDNDRRLEFESKLISTVSRCTNCHPSEHWIGAHSPKQKIRDSGLWLVNELYGEPLSDDDFSVLSN